MPWCLWRSFTVGFFAAFRILYASDLGSLYKQFASFVCFVPFNTTTLHPTGDLLLENELPQFSGSALTGGESMSDGTN